MHHELKGTGIRLQAVLPGGTRTKFFAVAGNPIDEMPEERRKLLMSPEDLVDAPLSGLDHGELITISPLAERSYWDDYEAARIKMLPLLSGVTRQRDDLAFETSALIDELLEPPRPASHRYDLCARTNQG